MSLAKTHPIHRCFDLSCESVRQPLLVRGFTLLELLVVIVIIGLLTAVVGPRFFAQIGKSEQGTVRAQMDAFSKALESPIPLLRVPSR